MVKPTLWNSKKGGGVGLLPPPNKNWISITNKNYIFLTITALFKGYLFQNTGA
jgi:hypothetical protein